MDKIAVLIPCYNEEKTIAKVVKDAKEALPEAVIYVYDNNSKDRTVEFAKEAGAQIRYEHMQGKGNVIRRMFREIEAECYIMVDGDDTYPMEYAREMADKVLNHNADMVVGTGFLPLILRKISALFTISGTALSAAVSINFFAVISKIL